MAHSVRVALGKVGTTRVSGSQCAGGAGRGGHNTGAWHGIGI